MAFPDNIQTFLRAVDPSTTLDAQNIQTYQNYIQQGDFAGAQNFLAQMTNGNAMNLNASRYNEVIQTIQDIQTFYFGLNGVVDYINSNIDKYINIAPYSNATNYVSGNLVGSNSTYYLCTQNNGPDSTVVEPNVTENWQNYWTLFLQQQNPIRYPIKSTQPTGQNIGDLWFQLMNNWNQFTWGGITNLSAENIWTDGENYYYSAGNTEPLMGTVYYQFKLPKGSQTWQTQTWNGTTSLYGQYIWTDGENIYYSTGTTQLVLDKSTSTWNQQTWTGLNNFDRQYIWTDGTNIYYSNGTTQYILDTNTNTWNQQTWTGLNNFSGKYIWTDGTNIYYTSGSSYILNTQTNTWTEKTWVNIDINSGIYIWTDGENIYYSTGTTQLVLDKSTSTWNQQTWTGLNNFDGNDIWNDGTYLYYSNGPTQYINFDYYG